ncbi:MAG: tRNA pseudouridine synthase A [Candidatus Omnitrophica bacterium]|nr:tRNA pseudouridine synthase A [Candidatus Omnitrophota bacterium]
MVYKFTIAYDGTGFAGWQRQRNAPTVQGTLERTLEGILGEKVHLVGSGRTDSGVHAEGQVAHAAIRSRMPASTLRRALNALLPPEILVRSVQRTGPRFHARYSAKRKLYRYSIWNSPLRPLFERNQVFHVASPLDLPAMRRAARLLKGRRDFRAFCSEPGGASGAASSKLLSSNVPPAGGASASGSHTVRTLHSVRIHRKRNLIRIEMEGDGFLYHMVRRIAGLLVEIGKGKAPPAVAPTAPAKGLCLVRVHYPLARPGV